MCTILCNPQLRSVRDTRFLHSVLLFPARYKRSASFKLSDTRSFRKEDPSVTRQGNALTEQQWTPVTAQNVSFLRLTLCFLYLVAVCSSLKPANCFLAGSCSCGGSCTCTNCACTTCKKSKYCNVYRDELICCLKYGASLALFIV